MFIEFHITWYMYVYPEPRDSRHDGWNFAHLLLWWISRGILFHFFGVAFGFQILHWTLKVTGTCWWLVFQILQLGLQIIWKLLKLRPVRYIPDSFWNECPPPSIYETEQWKSFVKIEQHFKTCIVKSTLKISNIHTGCHFEASKSYAQKAKIYFSRLGSFCCFWKSYP